MHVHVCVHVCVAKLVQLHTYAKTAKYAWAATYSGKEGKDGATSVAANDGDADLLGVKALLVSNERARTHNVKGGHTKQAKPQPHAFESEGKLNV